MVSDLTLKYFNSVLNEESLQEISKDIGKPDNDLLALPVLNDIIEKADQVITNKGLLHGDEVICRCQDHLLTGVFPLLKLWQSVREGVELNEEVFLGSIQCSIVSMGSAFLACLLMEDTDLNRFFPRSAQVYFGDNLHEKLKKISEEQKLIKQASSVLGKNMNNNTRNFRKRSRSSQNKFRRSGSDHRRIILRNKYQKIVNFQTKYKQKKKTHRPTSDWETKVFPKRMKKNLHRQNSFKLCKKIRNSYDFKTFSAQASRLNPRILDRVSFIKIRNRQIASERSNRTSGKFRTRIICEPPFHSSEIKWPKTSCYQFEAAKQTRLQSKISNGKPGKYSFTSKTRRLQDKDRLTGRMYVSAGCTKIKKSSSFYFRWKDLPFQSDAFRPELCTKNIYQTVQTNSQTAEVSRNAFDNIFGRYTSNCSNSRSVPSSGQILNETTSRSGILSEHKQVSSYSPQRIIFLGFLIDSVNMTISLPEEKQLAIIQ